MAGRSIAWLTLLVAGSALAEGDWYKPHHDLRYQDAYYPEPYYSRAYLQDYPLDPGDRPLLFRLHPFQHYGRYKYGEPIEPCLTNGTVESYRFPYRYCWNFRPTQAPQPIPFNPCDDPAARQYQDLVGGVKEAPAPNEPAELPLPQENGSFR